MVDTRLVNLNKDGKQDLFMHHRFTDCFWNKTDVKEPQRLTMLITQQGRSHQHVDICLRLAPDCGQLLRRRLASNEMMGTFLRMNHIESVVRISRILNSYLRYAFTSGTNGRRSSKRDRPTLRAAS